MYPDYQRLLVAIDGGIAVVKLHRPESRNAWGLVMKQELHDVMQRLDLDDDVRVVVLTGSGRWFTVGADMSTGTLGADGDLGPGIDRSATMLPKDVRKPVIAAINGDAVGAGASFPLLCDIRFVAEDAKIGFVFARRGVVPEFGSSWTLPRMVGVHIAAELILSGRILSGAEATALGLYNRALPADEVLPHAVRLAEDIVANTAPLSVAASKRLIWDGLDRTYADAETVEMQWFSWATKQPDAREGIMSFLEKRAPQWQGRISELPDAP